MRVPRGSVTGVRYPEEEWYGRLVHVEVDVKNVGEAAGKLFAYIMNPYTGETVSPVAYTSVLPVNGSQTLTLDAVHRQEGYRVMVGHQQRTPRMERVDASLNLRLKALIEGMKLEKRLKQ